MTVAWQTYMQGMCGTWVALRSGSTLPLGDVYGDAANAYDICDIYGKMCF